MKKDFDKAIVIVESDKQALAVVGRSTDAAPSAVAIFEKRPCRKESLSWAKFLQPKLRMDPMISLIFLVMRLVGLVPPKWPHRPTE